MDRTRLIELPKVELHNHLDGGLRVDTVIELANDIGYVGLPTGDPNELRGWFYRGGSGSLERYLEGFEHTIAVMQTRRAIERVAYEAGLDLYADGVVYAEIRFAPVLNTHRGLRREDAIEAALLGFARARSETGVIINLIVDAMRNMPDSELDAKAAVAFADAGVVGFDLAGPEAGYPAGEHRRACAHARDHGLNLTIHAGEADGPSSIAAALDECGANRIGHGIRITGDIDGETLGPIATRLHREQIPLEVCPTSNLHTLGIAADAHPLGRLHRAGFNVTLNTDNRLMSAVTLTDEFELAVKHHQFTEADLHRVTRNAVAAAFTDDRTRRRLNDVVDAAYAN
ncbi:MAG: adenosine deaminase [Acidimicrobiia bacterium]|nr:adenosine deaminase [Acidimicrobiia bacterium]